MNKLKLIKLDSRYSGFPIWQFMAQSNNTQNRLDFHKGRVWCWEQWGPSKELFYFGHTDKYDNIDCSNNKWCWSTVDRFARIYLRTETEASMFSLSWIV